MSSCLKDWSLVRFSHRKSICLHWQGQIEVISRCKHVTVVECSGSPNRSWRYLGAMPSERSYEISLINQITRDILLQPRTGRRPPCSWLPWISWKPCDSCQSGDNFVDSFDREQHSCSSSGLSLFMGAFTYVLWLGTVYPRPDVASYQILESVYGGVHLRIMTCHCLSEARCGKLPDTRVCLWGRSLTYDDMALSIRGQMWQVTRY